MNILRMIGRVWRSVGQKVGDFLARVMLSLFYFTVFMPFAIGLRLFQDPLKQKARNTRTYWEDHQVQPTSLDDARRGF